MRADRFQRKALELPVAKFFREQIRNAKVPASSLRLYIVGE